MSDPLVVNLHRDLDLVLLAGQNPGPAGDAGISLESGISCRFDAIRPGCVTTVWIDIETVRHNALALLLGKADAESLLGGRLSMNKTVELHAEAALVLSRLAFLDLLQSLPMNEAPADAWAVEEAVLWDQLRSLGFDVEKRVRSAAGAALTSLLQTDPKAADGIERAALDIAIRLLPDSIQREQLLNIQEALVSYPVEPVLTAELARPLVMMSQLAMVDTLWIHLKSEHMPSAEFSGTVAVETYPHEGTTRLKISTRRPGDCSSPLFVRCIDEASEELPITFADSMDQTETHYVSEANAPPGFDIASTRIEVVASLNLEVLPPHQHVAARAQQWALLALRSTRFNDNSSARRQWLFSSRLYEEANMPVLADSTSEMSTTPQEIHSGLWAETEKVRRRPSDGV